MTDTHDWVGKPRRSGAWRALRRIGRGVLALVLLLLVVAGGGAAWLWHASTVGLTSAPQPKGASLLAYADEPPARATADDPAGTFVMPASVQIVGAC